jgi:hypothetical protein
MVVTASYPIVADVVSSSSLTNFATTTSSSLTVITIASNVPNTTLSYTSDISFSFVDLDNLVIPENYSRVISTEILCSVSGGTPITLSIAANGNNPVPDWVTANSTSGEVSFTTPFVDEDTTFTFALSGAIGTDSYSKPI